MFQQVAHPVVAVAALESGVEHYAALLGCAPEPRGADATGAVFRLGNGDLLLRPMGRAEGLVALRFAAADPDACAATLAARGIAVEPHAAGRGFDLPLAATRGLRLACVGTRSWPGRASPPKPSEVSGLDHVVVASPDLEAARRLYGDLLGLRLALDRRFEARGLRILFFRVGGVSLEVVGRLDAPADPEAVDRFGGLAWRVGDPGAARERVAAAGFDVSPVRPGAKPGTLVCTVRSGTCGVPTLLIGPDFAGPRAR